MKNIELLYPELQKTDGLPQALQSEFVSPASNLKIQGRKFSESIWFMESQEDDIFYHSPTKVISKNDRWVYVDIALERRLFILTMGEKEETERAFLETISLQSCFAAIQAWLTDQMSVAHLKDIDAVANFLDLSDDVQYIRWQWARRHRQAINAGIFTRLLAPLFARAMQDPILSQLTPYTSHDALFLSRYIEFPFSNAGLPGCAPLLSISLDNYCRKIIRDKNIELAKEALQKIPPEFELTLKQGQNEYELLNSHQQVIGKGDALVILKSVLEYTYGKFEVFSNKIRIGVGNPEQATILMRESIPESMGHAIRHGGEEP